MPGAFLYTRFIKQIADTVGLDGAALLEEHASEIPQAVVKTTHRQLIRLLQVIVHV